MNCDRCNFTTTYQSLWDRHIESKKHNEIEKEDFCCKKCDFTTKYKSLWNTHCESIKHNEIEKEDFCCKKCDFTTKYKSLWDTHCESIKHNKKVYNCDKCNNVYENEFELIKHMKIHIVLNPDEISKKTFKKWIQYHIHKHYKVPITEPSDKEIYDLLQYGYEYDKKPTNIEVFEEITDIIKKHITYHLHKECGFPIIEPTDEDRKKLLPNIWERRP